MAGAELQEKAERPAYVRFEKVAVEDKPASLAAGHYVAKDVDFALITPPYSRDVIRIKVTQWMLNLEQDLRNSRIPEAWVTQYKDAYRSWQNGQEIPLKGTAIKGWGVISPAAQETLLRLNILTVEDLAQINDEGVRRIGMGASELKHKALAWLKQLSDKGPLTQENAALRREVETLKATVVTLEETVKRIQVEKSIIADPMVDDEESLIDPEPIRRGPGRPRKDATQ